MESVILKCEEKLKQHYLERLTEEEAV
jgi:hypothetical protein